MRSLICNQYPDWQKLFHDETKDKPKFNKMVAELNKRIRLLLEGGVTGELMFPYWTVRSEEGAAAGPAGADGTKGKRADMVRAFIRLLASQYRNTKFVSSLGSLSWHDGATGVGFSPAAAVLLGCCLNALDVANLVNTNWILRYLDPTINMLI